jgi:hypothetical protein
MDLILMLRANRSDRSRLSGAALRGTAVIAVEATFGATKLSWFIVERRFLQRGIPSRDDRPAVALRVREVRP